MLKDHIWRDMTKASSAHSSIILPSENQTREFDAKLLLACILAERGHQVVIGARHAIHNAIADFPAGIYMAKDFRKPSERILALIAGLGHTLWRGMKKVWCSPCPNFITHAATRETPLPMCVTSSPGGRPNRRLMQGAPQWPDLPIHDTGNPRLDLLRPELRGFHADEVARLRQTHGRFVLFDTNFASFNPAVTSVAPVLADTGGALSPYLQGRKRLFERWKALVPQLAEAMAPAKLIIRPHPAEAHLTWKKIAEKHNNIVVVHEGSALAWILAADAMVHSGCTTGLEAFFMGQMPISFRPESLVPLEQDLPDSLSLIAEDEPSLFGW